MVYKGIAGLGIEQYIKAASFFTDILMQVREDIPIEFQQKDRKREWTNDEKNLLFSHILKLLLYANMFAYYPGGFKKNFTNIGDDSKNPYNLSSENLSEYFRNYLESFLYPNEPKEFDEYLSKGKGFDKYLLARCALEIDKDKIIVLFGKDNKKYTYDQLEVNHIFLREKVVGQFALAQFLDDVDTYFQNKARDKGDDGTRGEEEKSGDEGPACKKRRVIGDGVKTRSSSKPDPLHETGDVSSLKEVSIYKD